MFRVGGSPHLCPTPGWKVVDGITVPQPVCSPDIPNLEANDSNLAVWFCTKCFLSPLEQPPHFEMCSSCSDNYYFPFPPTLPKDWICFTCQGLEQGEIRAFRQCQQCNITEEVFLVSFGGHCTVTQWLFTTLGCSI